MLVGTTAVYLPQGESECPYKNLFPHCRQPSRGEGTGWERQINEQKPGSPTMLVVWEKLLVGETLSGVERGE